MSARNPGRLQVDRAILESEPWLRFGVFVAVLAAMAAWELAAPRRRQQVSPLARWPGNIGMVAVGTLLLRLAFPTAAVGLAVVAEERGWGLLNTLTLPWWASAAAGFVLLDLVIYLQHVMFHAVPALWRLHRVHHADLECDVTTGVRFHPVEILLSMAIKLGAVAALGPPALAVLLFEIVLNAASLFNHGNVRVPAGIDRWLRRVVVTPDMHRIHHSARPHETNSNFGFSLSWWDRLLGTYRDQPDAGHDAMTLGLDQFRDPRELRLDRMLIQPLRGPAENPLGRG
jgi:sterol desaturase/sphingolipid hydroxylase (fatty acid hydroxylase superfamily)